MTRQLADTQAIAIITGRKPGTIRSWASRYEDKLPRRGRDARGRTLYDVDEAQKLAAELDLLAKRLTARNTEPSARPCPPPGGDG